MIPVVRRVLGAAARGNVLDAPRMIYGDEIQRRGVQRQLRFRTSFGTVSKRAMNRGFFDGMAFRRRRIIPSQLGRTLDRLQDWKPTE